MAQTAMTTNLPSIVNSPGRPTDYSPVRIDGRGGASSALAMSAAKPLLNRHSDSLPNLAAPRDVMRESGRNSGKSFYDSIENIKPLRMNGSSIIIEKQKPAANVSRVSASAVAYGIIKDEPIKLSKTHK